MSPSVRQRNGGNARPFGEIARALLRKKKFHEKGKFGALVDAWGGLVGQAVAERSRIRAFKDGVMVVEVDSPVLLHELNSFMKKHLLVSLQATEGGRDVAEIRLCLGTARGSRGAGGSGRAGSR